MKIIVTEQLDSYTRNKYKKKEEIRNCGTISGWSLNRPTITK